MITTETEATIRAACAEHISVQRAELQELGRKLGIPVLFLKGAWADPLLYGGLGRRLGGDIDVLVPRGAWRPFSESLVRRGFSKIIHPRYPLSQRFWQKEASFRSTIRMFPVDLHRDLADWPWFKIDVESWIANARSYPTVAGPIWSLSPEHQIAYCALHCANHGFVGCSAHVEDIRRFLEYTPIDWKSVRDIVNQGGLVVPYLVLRELLRVPADTTPHASGTSRQRACAAMFSVLHSRDHARPRMSPADALVRMSLLSSRSGSLPLSVLKSFLLRLADESWRLFRAPGD